jgi:hypothetical protein
MERHEINVATKQYVEVLAVADPAHDQPHYLLIETEESCCMQRVGADERWSDAKIDVAARYLFGPLHEQIGTLVCTMGGSTPSYDSVTITHGDMMVKPSALRGLHIGTCLFARVVGWAMSMSPDRVVTRITLGVGDAYAENKTRRNTMYERFGIRFVYRDANGIAGAEGHSDPDLRVRDLVGHRSWTNIRSCGLGALRDLAQSHQALHRSERRHRRMASVYRRRATKIDERLGSAIRAFVRWPLVAAAAIVGFAFGKYGLDGLWTLLTLR